MLVKTNQACEFFEINKSTLTAWKRIGADVAYVGRDKWDLKALNLWWVQHIYEGPTPDDVDGTTAEAKRRFWLARADRERMRADQEAGQLIPRPEVAAGWAARAAEVAATLEALSVRLSSSLPGQPTDAVRRKVQTEIRAIRTAFYRHGQFTDGRIAERVLQILDAEDFFKTKGKEQS